MDTSPQNNGPELGILVPDSTEQREPLLLWTFERARIFKIVMERDSLAGENRTAFFRVVADRDNVVE